MYILYHIIYDDAYLSFFLLITHTFIDFTLSFISKKVNLTLLNEIADKRLI